MRRAGRETGCSNRTWYTNEGVALLERAPWRGTYPYYFGYWFYFFGFTRPSHARARGEGRR